MRHYDMAQESPIELVMNDLFDASLVAIGLAIA